MQAMAGVLVLAGGLLATGPAAGAVQMPREAAGPVPHGTTCATPVTAAPTGPATVAAVRGPYGPALVVGSGPNADCSLYLLTSDPTTSPATSFACPAPPATVPAAFSCATNVWPALLTKGAPVAGPGVNPRLLGTVPRPDIGHRLGLASPPLQVTYNGSPLYQFFFDKAPGQSNGEDLFDGHTTPPGVWYRVEPARGLPAPGTATLTLEGVAHANTSAVPVPPVILGALVNTGAGDTVVPVYTFTGDTPGRSNCTGQCAVIWPPLLTRGRAQGTIGVDGHALGTIRRPDGSRQVTYMGQPLYLFKLDAMSLNTVPPPSSGNNTVTGQGLGAKFCPAGMSSCTGFYTVAP